MPEFGGLPTSIEALIIIALVVSPGYVFTQIARRSIAHIQEPTDLRFLLTIITAGLGIQLLFFPLYTRYVVSWYVSGTLLDHQVGMFIWVLIVCFVAPFGLGAFAGKAVSWAPIEKVLDAIGLGYTDRMPSAWDYVIRQKGSRYVRVHLKDGRLVGGVYHTSSLASSDPGRPDLYSEQAWQLTEAGEFVKAFSGTSGVWISHETMDHVYFYFGEDEQDDKAAEPATDPEDASGRA